MNVSIGLAFLGGLASFFSPCVLSMIPLYIGYISGRSLSSDPNEANLHKFRPLVFLHGVMFILGFSFVFIFLGATLSFLGGYLTSYKWLINLLTGLFILFMGLHLSGLLRIRWLDYDLRLRATLNTRQNLITSFVLGVTFAAGWSPCYGPILGPILALSMNEGSVNAGILYLTFYSAGMAIPFIFATLTIEWISVFIRKNRNILVYFEKGVGIVLIGIGVLLLTGLYDNLAACLGLF